MKVSIELKGKRTVNATSEVSGEILTCKVTETITENFDITEWYLERIYGLADVEIINVTIDLSKKEVK